MRIAIASGTSINRSEVFSDWETRSVKTPFGEVELKAKGRLVAMNRHGFENPLPPHAINYRANVAALDELGIESAITLNSVGSLDEALPPASMVSCSDYMSFAPLTFIDDCMSAFAPELGNLLLEEIASAWPGKIESDRIYFQTPGPRFETKAEVRALRAMGAHVVGMTLANEADLLLERGISVTAFCMVDNYAHGIGALKLSDETFEGLVGENQKTVDSFLNTLVAMYL